MYKKGWYILINNFRLKYPLNLYTRIFLISPKRYPFFRIGSIRKKINPIPNVNGGIKSSHEIKLNCSVTQKASHNKQSEMLNKVDSYIRTKRTLLTICVLTHRLSFVNRSPTSQVTVECYACVIRFWCLYFTTRIPEQRSLKQSFHSTLLLSN